MLCYHLSKRALYIITLAVLAHCAPYTRAMLSSSTQPPSKRYRQTVYVEQTENAPSNSNDTSNLIVGLTPAELQKRAKNFLELMQLNIGKAQHYLYLPPNAHANIKLVVTKLANNPTDSAPFIQAAHDLQKADAKICNPHTYQYKNHYYSSVKRIWTIAINDQAASNAILPRIILALETLFVHESPMNKSMIWGLKQSLSTDKFYKPLILFTKTNVNLQALKTPSGNATIAAYIQKKHPRAHEELQKCRFIHTPSPAAALVADQPASTEQSQPTPPPQTTTCPQTLEINPTLYNVAYNAAFHSTIAQSTEKTPNKTPNISCSTALSEEELRHIGLLYQLYAKHNPINNNQ